MTAFSHIGLCVSDLAASTRFYVEGLGFEAADGFEIGTHFGPALEVEGDITLTSQFIKRDDLSIELLGWQVPRPVGTPVTTRHTLGLTHLSFLVPDPPATAQRLVDLGGTLLESTWTAYAPGGEPRDIVFLADPDGTRVELMRTFG